LLQPKAPSFPDDRKIGAGHRTAVAAMGRRFGGRNVPRPDFTNHDRDALAGDV
jgi:hypothetical protein